MGTTEDPHMLFDLNDLIQQTVDLGHLDQPFTKEEIDQVIKEIPAEKAPGPDGFNALFLKKCWNIVKADLYQLCEDFFNGVLDLTAISSSFITLVPKIPNPVSVNDFRPISLLNSVLKLLTKLMSKRLQQVILQLIHENQYGFIKTRTIQDCLA